MAAPKTPNGFSINKGDNYIGIFGKDIPSPLGRIAFVDTLTKAAGTPTPKFGVALLIDKNDEAQKPELKAIQEMAKLMAIDLWGEQAANMLKKIKRNVFSNGDEPSSTGKIYEGYPGNWVINARNAYPAGHAKGFKVYGNFEVEQFQSGMICRLVISPYLNSDGFSYTLRAIKMVKDDGVRFGGAPDPTNLLDNLDQAVAAVTTNSEINLEGLI